MNSIDNFLVENSDEIIVGIICLVIGLIIPFLSKQLSKFFKWFWKKIKQIKQNIKEKRRIKKMHKRGEFTLNELIEIGKMPLEKRTSQQQIAYEKYQQMTKEMIENIKNIGFPSYRI